MIYKINKGVGKSFEFKGLRTTYVFVALAGLICSILLYFFFGLFLPFGVTITCVLLFSSISIGGAYFMNARFGENGFAFTRARWKTVRYIQNNQRVKHLVFVSDNTLS